jgi:hypothetical protein
MMSLKNLTWFKEKEPKPRAEIDWFKSSENDIRKKVAQILKVKESGLG